MTRSFAVVMAIGGLLALASPAAAQGRGRGGDDIPPGHRPPPGMCRIWIDGVPPGQQPAPTDCATAVRNRPSNGRVIFGDDYARPGHSGEQQQFDDQGTRPERWTGEQPRKDGKNDRNDHKDRERQDSGRSHKPPCIDRNHDGRCEAVPEKRTPPSAASLVGAIFSRHH